MAKKDRSTRYLGIAVEVKPFLSTKHMFHLRDTRQIPLMATGWCADYPDPQNFLEVLFSTETVENHFGYSDAEVDLMLASAGMEPDPTERITVYREVEHRVLSDWIAFPLSHSISYKLIKPHVFGFKVAPMGIHILRHVSLDWN